MSLFRLRSTLAFLTLTLASGSSFAAGSSPTPAPSDDEDLEVPSTPTAPPAGSPSASPAPGAPTTGVAGSGAPAAPAPGAAPTAAPSNATPPVAPPPSSPTPSNAASADPKTAELERRLAAVEAELARREKLDDEHAAHPAQANATPSFPEIVNLEKTAHSRPIPTGFVISGYLQADYDHSQLSQDQLQQGVPLNQNEFLLRRGRIRVDQGWDYAVATLELDANTVNGVSVGIRRAEASLFYRGNNGKDLPPLVMLTGGITDPPFGYELLQSARMRVFMERSLASSAFYPTEADAGVKVSGAASFLRYGLSLTNGQPLNNSGFPKDPNGAKDLTGRVGVVVPATKSIEIVGGTSFATGKGFHAGTDATKTTIQGSDTNGNGFVDPGETTFRPGQAASASQNFSRWLFGLDLGVHLTTKFGDTHVYGELYAASNYDRGYLTADPVVTGNVRELGGYAAITQQVTRYGLVGFRLSVYDPNSDAFESRAGNFVPKTQTVRTLSPVFGFELPDRARLLFEYDFIHDYLGRDRSGVPTDSRNDTWTARLQVDL